MTTALQALRQEMAKANVDIALIRSTDEYLNEYVPLHKSRRAFVTGFTGSVGDALVTADQAILFVDGRYILQATAEATEFDVRLVALGQSIESAWLNALDSLKPSPHKVRRGQGEGQVLAAEFDRIPVSLYERMQKRGQDLGFRIVDASTTLTLPSPDQREREMLPLRAVGKKLTGRTVEERLLQIAPRLKEMGVDAFFVTPLDEIAWLTNLRGADFPYQATFAAKALVFANEIWVETEPAHVKWAEKNGVEKGVKFVSPLTLPSREAKIGVDPDGTPIGVIEEIKKSGAQIVFAESPAKILKAKKTKEELLHMRESFARADHVVWQTQQWLIDSVLSGKQITEANVDSYVRKAFEDSGTIGLSFKPIVAADTNGAVIHYGHPDDKRAISAGELFLLDTGGLYEGGYATDLTRTFLVGSATTPATDKQKKLYTATLKGAIAGMSARFPKGTLGRQLDAIVRDPIWRAGYNFDHGTGHGVGINVHENPPRISPASNTPIEAGQVFSIEPGIYVPGWGGIRIENLCTAVEDEEESNYLRVLPLTFAPLDSNLILGELLTDFDKRFLAYYKKCFGLENTVMPPLPPCA